MINLFKNENIKLENQIESKNMEIESHLKTINELNEIKSEKVALEKQIELKSSEIKSHSEVLLKDFNMLKNEKEKLERELESKNLEIKTQLNLLKEFNELKSEKLKLEKQNEANSLEIRNHLESLKELNELKNEKVKFENQIEFNNLQIKNHLETIKELNETKIKLEQEKIDYFNLLKENASRDYSDKNEFDDLKNAFDKVYYLVGAFLMFFLKFVHIYKEKENLGFEINGLKHKNSQLFEERNSLFLEKTELLHKNELLNTKYQLLEEVKGNLDKEIVELNLSCEKLVKSNEKLNTDLNQSINEYTTQTRKSDSVSFFTKILFRIQHFGSQKKEIKVATEKLKSTESEINVLNDKLNELNNQKVILLFIFAL